MLSETTRIVPLISACLLIGICQTRSVFAIDPGYIAAVEADVAEFSSNEFKPPENSSWLGSTDHEALQMMDVEGFSDYLQTNSPGSYIFYKKLSQEYKERLHKDYLSTGDIDRVKQDIFKYTRELKQ
ncbi:MAG: hypothetical protein ABW098_17130 [Candidatus Thiodiazotropha sp.]